MKFKCSLNNNYEVIGLCDVEQYNKKIGEFSDKSWTQIILPEKLILPNNKKSIKSITKVYLDIKITSTKLIRTPSSDVPNAEGLILTGKILLVSGMICQRIVYISDTISNAVCSAKFNVNFNTYIVVEENTDLENDYFCIYPCVEDVSVRMLTDRILTKSITLFLFAHKTINNNNPPIPPEIFDTVFIFKSINVDEEIAKIEFDKFNLILNVTSTGVPYGSNPGQIAFEFKLLSSDGRIKILKAINSNQNANDFKNTLNNESFEVEDFIEITYLDSTKVNLVNYPNLNDIYKMSSSQNSERFLITKDGIKPILSPNKIIVKSKDNEEVLSIEFVEQRNIFVVSLLEVIPDSSSSDAYLIFVLKDINGDNLIKATLNSDEIGSDFKEKINLKAFETNKNSLSLVYKDKSKIEILNYPTKGESYAPSDNANIFLMEPNNLKDIMFNNKIKIFNDNDEEIANLYFMKAFSEPIVKIIGRVTSLTSTSLGDANKKYIELLTYSENNSKAYGNISTKETADRFISAIENIKFNILSQNILRLSNRENERIIITNYKSQDEYKIGEEPEFLEITRNSLIPHSLNYNKILLKNFIRGNILYIYFDKLTNGDVFIEPYSTGVVNNDADYFTFKITNSAETDTKLEGRINKGETGDVISINPLFNISKDFNFGDLFIFTYSFNKLVKIFDPPFTTPSYYATGISEKFILSRNGFEKIPSIKFQNAFLFKTYDTQENMAIVEFDIANKKLIVTSLGNNCNAPSETGVFSFDLIDSSKQTVRIGFINGKDNADSFRDDLNGYNFDYNYIIRLVFASRPKVVLTNYPSRGDTYNMISYDDQTFKITSTGIVPNVFKNKITVNDLNNNPIVIIEFDAYWKKFLITSTGRNAPVTSSINYFTMTLYNSDGTTEMISSNIRGGSNANLFKDEFNNNVFKVGYFFSIRYKESRVVSISNYPNEGTPSYNPPGTEKIFKFTESGLE